MTDTVLHFTKRELHRVIFAPRFWAILVSAAIILGLAGPFGTYEALPLFARLAYWTFIAAATWFVGFACVLILIAWTNLHRKPAIGHAALAGALAGVPVAVLVSLFNRMVFPQPPDLGFAPLLGACVVIGALLSALFAGLVLPIRAAATEEAAGSESVAVGGAAEPGRPPLLDRLPAPLRGGRLLYLTMQDHYVEVHTDRGHALVLMRFADAIGEAGTQGLRIHRSHWVARDAVAATTRKRGRLFLKLADGALLPVSRSHLENVRRVGWR